MDKVSTMVHSVRVGSVNARQVRKAGQWGARYPAFTGSGFHIVTRGVGWLITDAREPVALAPGDAVLIPAGAEHGLSGSPRTLAELPAETRVEDDALPDQADFEFLCGAYHLDHGRVHPYLQMLPEAVALPRNRDQHRDLRPLINLLQNDVSADKSGPDVARRALMDLVLTHILLRYDDTPTLDDPTIDAALRLIHDDTRQRWTVEQLSRAVGLSRTVFSRRFASSVGVAPTAYMISQRLSYGAKLLKETTEPLAVISRRLGYSSEFAFSAAFRREYGIAPGRFRQQKKIPVS